MRETLRRFMPSPLFLMLAVGCSTQSSIPAEKLAENAALFATVDQLLASNLTDQAAIITKFGLTENKKVYYVKGSDDKAVNYIRLTYDRNKPDSGTAMAYFTFDPSGTATHTAGTGETVLARVTFKFDRPTRCITREIVEAHYGSARVGTSLLHSDVHWLWWAPSGQLRPEGTIVTAMYDRGVIAGCIGEIWVGRYRQAGTFR